MSAIEDLLDQSIKPTVTKPTEGNWEAVVVDGEARRRRHAAARRVGATGFVGVLFLLLFQVINSGPGFDVITTPPIGEPPPVLDAVPSVWPTSSEVFALAGKRPIGRLLSAWVVALVLPMLGGLWSWGRSSPGPNKPAFSVTTRAVRAVGAALFTVALLGIAVGAALMFLYDPLATQTGTSWLALTIELITLTARWVLIVALGAELASKPKRGWVLLCLYGPVVVLCRSALPAVLKTWLDWKQTVGSGTPTRGLWRLLFQGDSVYLGPDGALSAAGAWLGVVLAAIAGGIVLVWGRRLATTPADDTRSPSLDNPLPGKRTIFAGILVALAVLTFMRTAIAQDIRARERLYVVDLPSEIIDGGDFTISRSIDRNIFDEDSLFEIEIQGGDTSITSVSTEELLGDSRLKPNDNHFHRADALGYETGEVWEIERNEEQNFVRLRAAHKQNLALHTQNLLGINTSIFLAVLLILAATSRRLRNSEEERIPGRKQASWFSIVGALVVAVRLVESLFQLERDVGDRASRNGMDLFVVYTAGGEAAPISLYATSGWFFPFQFAVLLPLFGLALIGLRRLGVNKRAQAIVGLLAVVSTVALRIRFGTLIEDWSAWFID